MAFVFYCVSVLIIGLTILMYMALLVGFFKLIDNIEYKRFKRKVDNECP